MMTHFKRLPVPTAGHFVVNQSPRAHLTSTVVMMTTMGRGGEKSRPFGTPDRPGLHAQIFFSRLNFSVSNDFGADR